MKSNFDDSAGSLKKSIAKNEEELKDKKTPNFIYYYYYFSTLFTFPYEKKKTYHTFSQGIRFFKSFFSLKQ